MKDQILEALFSGAKAFVREAVTVVREAVSVILEEVDRSAFGRAATKLVSAVTDRYFARAQDLSEEEAGLAEKFRRDGRRTDADAERLAEIESERAELRRGLSAAKTKEATQDLRNRKDQLVSAPVTNDDASASSGIMASKECPECEGTMRIRQSGHIQGIDNRKFWWQCVAANSRCPTIPFDPKAGRTVLRTPDPDLDGPHAQRRQIWERQDVLAKTHGRLRTALGESDKEMICPHHALPMKLIPKASPGGRLLDSYEFVCLGVTPQGLACDQKVPVTAFSQVSAALRRRDGRGIIDG